MKEKNRIISSALMNIDERINIPAIANTVYGLNVLSL